jgi:hypothetical protein
MARSRDTDSQLQLSESERRVVDSLHHAAMTERAPLALRERIKASRPRSAVLARRRVGFGMGLSGALAAVVLVLVLALPGGTPGAPSLSQAAALATRGSTSPAPVVDPDDPTHQHLSSNVNDVYFPNWDKGPSPWTTTGQRIDRIDGRLAITVYYDKTLAYTIVASPPLAMPRKSAEVFKRTAFYTLRLDGRVVVAWEIHGNTCLLSSTSYVMQQTLLGLATSTVH